MTSTLYCDLHGLVTNAWQPAPPAKTPPIPKTSRQNPSSVTLLGDFFIHRAYFGNRGRGSRGRYQHLAKFGPGPKFENFLSARPGVSLAHFGHFSIVYSKTISFLENIIVELQMYFQHQLSPQSYLQQYFLKLNHL